MFLKMKFLLSIFLLCYLQSVTSMFCYWNTGCPYRFLASKTPYNILRGDIRDSLVKLTDCEPVSIWGLFRHGKRSPSQVFLAAMKDAMVLKDHVVNSYQHGSSSLCAQDIENLRNWTPEKNFFENPPKLDNEGYQDSVGIGKRWKEAFPELLKELGKDDYIFHPLKDTFVVDSLKGFIEGLDNKKFNIDQTKEGHDNIAVYQTCNKYLKDVTESNITNIEAEKYQSNSEFFATKDRLQRRLGIDSLTNANIIALWDLCRYTTNGLLNKFSPWCALFTTEDLKVLEYISDLQHYYRSGYGVSMNKMFGEIALAEMLKSFEEAKQGNGKKIKAYFTHSSSLDMAYTALGLFKDATPLTGQQRKLDRKWRTSKFAIFSSNLVAVLNKCGKDDKKDFNVVFYLNEEPLRTICKEGVCTWKEFEKKLSPFTETKTDFCDI